MNLTDLKIHPYGLILGLSLFAALNLVSRILKNYNFPKDFVEKAFFWVVIAGVVGARSYHVISEWQYYETNLSQVWQVWQGGLGIYGALMGGFVAIIWMGFRSRLSKSQFLILFDAIAISLPLAQAIGRFGNYVNQELYGFPTTLPWGITIDLSHRLPGYESISQYHPLFLYESLMSLLLLCLMGFLWKFKKIIIGSGMYLGVYGVGYGIIRWSLENFRLDRQFFGGQGLAQNISLMLVFSGVIWIFQVIKSRPKKYDRI